MQCKNLLLHQYLRSFGWTENDAQMRIKHYFQFSPIHLYVERFDGSEHIYNLALGGFREVNFNFKRKHVDEEMLKREFGIRFRELVDYDPAINLNGIADDLKISRVMLSRYINGKVLPSVERIMNIAKILDVDYTAMLISEHAPYGYDEEYNDRNYDK